MRPRGFNPRAPLLTGEITPSTDFSISMYLDLGRDSSAQSPRYEDLPLFSALDE
jgi:hypothetical protein